MGAKWMSDKDRIAQLDCDVGGLGVCVQQSRIGVKVAGRNGGGGRSRFDEKPPVKSVASQESAHRPRCPVAGTDVSVTSEGLE
jgi:hypothetical protein